MLAPFFLPICWVEELSPSMHRDNGMPYLSHCVKFKALIHLKLNWNITSSTTLRTSPDYTVNMTHNPCLSFSGVYITLQQFMLSLGAIVWDSTWWRSVNAADCVDSVGSCGWCWVWLMRVSLAVAACRLALPLVHLCQRWDGAVVGGHGLAGFLYCFFSLVSCLVWLSLTMVSHRCG